MPPMSTPTPHVLVTGATGFLGSRVVARLAAHGVRITAADARPDPEVEARLRTECGSQAPLTFVRLDVSDEPAVMRLLGGSPPITHCIHLAYLMNPDVEKDQRRGAMVNIYGMAVMFEAAAVHGLHRLVFASSETYYGARQDVFGPPDHAIKEDEGCAPGHHHFTYGVMKVLNEFVGQRYVRDRGVDIACVRPPVVFGHGRKRSSVLWSEHFASRPAVGEPVIMPFPAATRDCWIYKDDCAEQMVLLVLKDKISHFAYNTGGESVSGGVLAGTVRQWLPDARIEFEEDKPPTPLVDNICGERLAAEIGFRPRPLAEGVRAHINEARAEAGLPPV
jgi:nucleoside-diphosphate-sugar epimerase